MIPSSISLDEFPKPVDGIKGPFKCPLCKCTLDDDATQLAEAIACSLRAAGMNKAEAIALLRLLVGKYAERPPRSDVINVIEEKSPKQLPQESRNCRNVWSIAPAVRRGPLRYIPSRTGGALHQGRHVGARLLLGVRGALGAAERAYCA